VHTLDGRVADRLVVERILAAGCRILAAFDVSEFGVSHNCAQVPLNAGNKPFAAVLSHGESVR